MKRYFLIIIATLSFITIAAVSCAEPRYYRENHRHSDRYYHHHHHRSRADVDIHIHN